MGRVADSPSHRGPPASITDAGLSDNQPTNRPSPRQPVHHNGRNRQVEIGRNPPIFRHFRATRRGPSGGRPTIVDDSEGGLMRVSVTGCGYLGAVHAAAMAALGHDVVGVDIDREKVEALVAGVAPFYEPGLPELLAYGVSRAAGSGSPPTSVEVAGSTVHFVCVGTPQQESSNAADLTHVNAAFQALAGLVADGDIVVGKSTVPVGTATQLADDLSRRAPGTHVVWNPEFLREGWRCRTRLHPDRLVYGVPDGPAGQAAAQVLDEVYAAHAGGGDAPHGHGLRDRRAGQGRRELVPRDQDLLHQRDGRAVRGRRWRRHAARGRDRDRRADRTQVPQRGPGVRRRLPAEGHPGVHGPGGGAARRAGGELPQARSTRST